MANRTRTGLWWKRCGRRMGPRQRTLCHLGELNGSAQARGLKTIEGFNEQGESPAVEIVSDRGRATGRRSECGPGSVEQSSAGTKSAVRELLCRAGSVEAAGAGSVL